MVVVAHPEYGLYAGTDLDMVLRSSDDTLVVAGVATDAVHDFFIDTLFPSRGVEMVTALRPSA